MESRNWREVCKNCIYGPECEGKPRYNLETDRYSCSSFKDEKGKEMQQLADYGCMGMTRK